MTEKIVIDASFGSLGRIASFAAKQALRGKEVIVVNCNNALLSGSKEMILQEYKKARARKSLLNKGPHFPKSPERIMKRTIRGMLPYKQGRGLQALKKIRCFNSIPEEYEKVEKTTLRKDFKTKTLTLKELSQAL